MAIVDVLDHLPREQAQSSGFDRHSRSDCAVHWCKSRMKRRGFGIRSLICLSAQAIISKPPPLPCLCTRLPRECAKAILPQDFLFSARRGYHGLLQNLIKIDSQGLLTLEKVAAVPGLGGEPYRDGSFEYYVTEKIIPNDPKGVGPFILAALEMERAGVNCGDDRMTIVRGVRFGLQRARAWRGWRWADSGYARHPSCD